MNKTGIFRRLTALVLAAALTAALGVTAAAAEFTDVPASHWAAQSISRCAELGFFKGESATAFGVGKPMTRAAFATALCRFFGWDMTVSTQTPYEDVAPSAWYAGAVSAAYTAGAITTQRAAFRPEETITREEMAVMLVRALGCTTISGLAQDPPFTDVTTNTGYIAMAYDMGLVTGTTETTFSPDAPATREQAAVILMRLYDKLHASAPTAAALIRSWPEDGMDLTAYETVAVEGVLFAVAGKKPVLSKLVKEDDAPAIVSAIHDSGAQALLYASAKSTILKAAPADTAAVLLSAMEAGGYDGVYLDVEDVPVKSKSAMTALAEAVAEAMEGKTVYIGAEGPALSGSSTGYDYAALAALCDRLVVHIASPVVTASSFTSAPKEPVEELYYTLTSLRDIKNLTVSLSAVPTAWRGSAELTIPTAEEIASYLADGAQRHYSQRYACPYLHLEDNAVIWYCDGESAAARLQLMKLLGADSLIVDTAECASADFLAGLELN